MRPSSIRSHLSDLAALQARTDRDERKILAAAEARHDELQAKMQDLAKTAAVDDDAGSRYLAMAREFGQVSLIIAKARASLGN